MDIKRINMKFNKETYEMIVKGIGAIGMVVDWVCMTMYLL